jgi:tRNA1Val (adenine37-N6)-methyltransferase
MHRKNGSDKVFYFKQFEIQLDRCGMTGGPDGVVLGAWANGDHASQRLVLGAGPGVISLMLGERSSLAIGLQDVDIVQDAVVHAVE